MSVKKIAGKFLLENGINEFKFSFEYLVQIAHNNTWYLNGYNKVSEIINNPDISENCYDKKGFTCAISKDKKLEFYIFYKNDLSYDEKINVILHEIGHIMMKHTYHGSILDKKEDIDIKNKQEVEANMFACEVLAPSCVLEYLKKDTAEDIKNITRLSYDDSLKYITELHRAKDDYDDYIKNKILKQYKKCINSIKKNEFKDVISKNSFIKSAFLGLITLSIISIFSVMYLINKDTKTENSTEIQLNNKPSIEESTKENNIANKNIVYVTSAGKKYHLSDCRYIKNKTNIHKFSLDDAKKIGYRPCSLCIK